MPYRSTDKTRQKKDSKRMAMMQAAVRVFADKGYHTATIRDIVKTAGVAIGTFYFYFPDKETLFVHLYEETGVFVLNAIQQAIQGRPDFKSQIMVGLQAYINIATYEPAIIQLLLLGGIGAVPSLEVKWREFREKVVQMWQRPLDLALQNGQIPPQNSQRTAQALSGAFDQVILHLLSLPNPDEEADVALQELITFAFRACGYEDASSR